MNRCPKSLREYEGQFFDLQWNLVYVPTTVDEYLKFKNLVWSTEQNKCRILSQGEIRALVLEMS